jgi:hypothetical protein
VCDVIINVADDRFEFIGRLLQEKSVLAYTVSPHYTSRRYSL